MRVRMGRGPSLPRPPVTLRVGNDPWGWCAGHLAQCSEFEGFCCVYAVSHLSCPFHDLDACASTDGARREFGAWYDFDDEKVIYPSWPTWRIVAGMCPSLEAP